MCVWVRYVRYFGVAPDYADESGGIFVGWVVNDNYTTFGLVSTKSPAWSILDCICGLSCCRVWAVVYRVLS